MVKVVVIVGAGYLAYEMGWLSFLGLNPTPAAASAATTVPAKVLPPVTNTPSLATVYAQLLAAAKPPSAGLSADQWGFYLNQILGPLGKSAPDPLPLFSAAYGSASTPWDRSTLYNAATYWGVMAPALTSQYGMTGLGHLGRLALSGGGAW